MVMTMAMMMTFTEKAKDRRQSKGKVLVRVLSKSVTAWTVAHQAPLPFGFPRQEYWSG